MGSRAIYRNKRDENEFSLGYVKFEMPAEYPNGDIKKVLQYMTIRYKFGNHQNIEGI